MATPFFFLLVQKTGELLVALAMAELESTHSIRDESLLLA